MGAWGVVCVCVRACVGDQCLFGIGERHPFPVLLSLDAC